MFASSAGHSKPGAHGGILQEFKKKTMQKIVKYAASSPADEGTDPQVVVSPTGSFGKRQIISPRGNGNASKDAMTTRIKRFEEQDVILRELETEMTAMLQQLQGACAAMGRVVEVFTQSFRYDNVAYRSGVDYLAAVKMIRREGAQLMEQAIRFTVLDPLILQLKRHDQLKHKIDLWQKLHAEFEEAQLSLDFMRAMRQDKEDKRHKAEVKLGLLGDQLQSLEKELKHAIGDSCLTGKVGLSYLLSSNERFVYGIAGYLRCDDLGRLAKVNHQLRNLILETPAVWKRSIRAGGLSSQNRSAVWLGVLYGSTPWLSQTAVPHHLSSTEKRKCVYEGLLIKLGTRIANGLFEDQSRAEDDTKLVTWLREIDVDVARTCKKDIYAEDVAEEWNSSFGTSSAAVRNSNAPEVIISSKFKNQRQSKNSPESPRTSAKGKRTELESKIRRVLRSYVMYNPRVGYCQGMNFLVRLLIEVAIDEADCFWLFVGLSEPENDRNLYEPGLAVLQPLFVRFEECFAKQKPELYGHFQQEGVPVAAYTARWFLTLFSKFETFGPTLVIRILDLFVIDGWRTIFSMGLVVLDELESELLQADMETILQLLQFPRNAMVEPDHTRRRQLLRHALAFSITRSMTSTIR
ncbi:hypothetical protein Poli38472_006413 [Pythium oligandrum]|uniref:Rab-GAP TBC domain-containing protein n=1 Tax=Pythium oligandrum TaxID=41045 RepID=A0A8K1C4S2_PYTOL|nr:hypothetical protein Poli38472_006413 [Pythium oligandrum]|eukprot:TMW56403.1 hypothetical protein Poli38472_006413 [Pythium oligandrum]